MSSSQNSEKTPSWQPEHETKVFEKFGMTFTLHVVTETRNQWTRVIKDQNDDIVKDPSPDMLKKMVEHGAKLRPDWIETDAKVAKSYVEFVTVTDQEDCQNARVEIIATPDGPILGIVKEETEREITLLDPCVVTVNDQNGTISYMPIFNVARTLRLERSAIRSRQAPAEIIVASYPGFILQNRMYLYQLAAKIPMAVSPELDNEADEAVTTAIA